ncbi:MAG: hypothetical protein GOV01_02535 [Candidatus Altiarchaeota archaeon]|nr:hypothetical protein [Candidatus Altiarchaeota archaeon]
MVSSIETLLRERAVARLTDFELDRFLNTYEKGYQDNLKCMDFVLDKFPRWGIVIGYFAMHDISKLLIAKKQMLKVNTNAHKNTIELLRGLVQDRSLTKLLEEGYEDFKSLADELTDAKRERVRAQYYKGTPVLGEQWKADAHSFAKNVKDFVTRIEELLG